MKKLAVLLIALFVSACGGGDDSTTVADSSVKAADGTCIGTTGQTCTGIEDYDACMQENCGTEWSALQSSCSALVNCQKKCPCDDNNEQCVENCAQTSVSASCLEASMSFGFCMMGAGCEQPVCEDLDNGTEEDIISNDEDVTTSGGNAACQFDDEICTEYSEASVTMGFNQTACEAGGGTWKDAGCPAADVAATCTLANGDKYFCYVLDGETEAASEVACQSMCDGLSGTFDSGM